MNMKLIEKTLRAKPRVFCSQLKVMDENVKSSPAWKGSVSMLEGQSMLDGQTPYTYILSKGVDTYHYFLHYVGTDRKVHFKNVRILYIDGEPFYRNGGGVYCKNIEDLIPNCLRCSSSICKPLI